MSRLRAALDAGPAVYGWEQDQRWTLKRVTELIMRMFGVPYTLRGVSCLLHRNGFTPQVPAHRAAERDEDAIAEWRTVTWPKIRGLAAAAVRSRLTRIQRQPALIAGFLGQTGLTLESQPP